MKKLCSCIYLFLLLSACTDQKKQEEQNKEADSLHQHHSPAASSADYADSVNRGLVQTDTMKGSPHRTAMKTVAGTHVHIEYSSPGVKGRTIWGGLVAWDQVWVAGAHDATRIRFQKEVMIGGRKIPAGTYAFFAIPGKETWTLVLNTNYEQHLADEYKEQEDVVRVQVRPEQHALTQRLTYEVEETGEKAGAVSLLWENIRVRLEFKVM